MAATPKFLSLVDVLEIHSDQIERYGGEPGLRDHGLLDSALAMPAAGIKDQYLHEDICAMAAAYLFHIVKNHPFVDGNKRAGAMAAFVFLGLNGLALDAPEPAYEQLVLSVAESRAGKDEIAEFFRKNTAKR
jgi:death on curing protein